MRNDVQNKQNHSIVMLQVTTESGNITYLAIFFGSLDFFFQEWLGLSSFVSGISCPLTFANKKQTFVKELFMAPQWTEHRTWSTWHLVLVAAVISTLSKQQPVTYTHVTFFNGLTPAQSRPRANNYGPNVDCRVSHSTSCLLVKFHHATILYKNSYLLFISFTGELSVDNQINRFFHGDSGDSYEKQVNISTWTNPGPSTVNNSTNRALLTSPKLGKLIPLQSMSRARLRAWQSTRSMVERELNVLCQCGQMTVKLA